jgi:hypothetical protein
MPVGCRSLTREDRDKKRTKSDEQLQENDHAQKNRDDGSALGPVTVTPTTSAALELWRCDTPIPELHDAGSQPLCRCRLRGHHPDVTDDVTDVGPARENVRP